MRYQYFTLILAIVICALVQQRQAIKVEEVYFGSGNVWAGPTPTWVMCDVTEDMDEMVNEVKFHHESELVYHWVYNQSIEAFGILADNVEINYGNMSSWDIKITRIKSQMEGNFSCTAISDTGSTDTNSFHFIVNYTPNSTVDTVVSDLQCTANALFTFPRAFPRPLAICYMNHRGEDFKERVEGSETVFEHDDGTYFFQSNLSVNFTAYPEGSFLRCHDYLYGDEIELLLWTPREGKSCSALPPTHPAYNMTDLTTFPACRDETQLRPGSRVTYTCRMDSDVKVTSICDPLTGDWSLDLTSEITWDTCAGSTLLQTWSLLLFSTLLIFIQYR